MLPHQEQKNVFCLKSLNSFANHLLEIGVVGKAHGIKGEVRLQYYAESLNLLDGEIWLQSGNKLPYKCEICSIRLHQGIPIVRFLGIEDRSTADSIRGLRVLVAQSVLPKEDGEVYLYEILGFSVILNENDRVLGRLDHVEFMGEQETWSIITPDNKEVLFPAVPQFVNEIDREKQEIRVTPPAGLLELYLD